jgi:FkbM family methyltransferase
MISYAQNFEDVILNRVFAGKSDGFYIDVGAGHPETDSVTRWLYGQGWCGVNVEPVPFLHELLVASRPRDVNLNCAVGAHAEPSRTFYEVSITGWSSFDPDCIALARQHDATITERTVPVLPLRDICARHVHGPIDFLKVDVEGWEREVLSGGDWQSYRPKVVVVEATRPNSSTPNHDQWEQILTDNGFIFAYFDGLNRFYVEEGHRDLIPRLALPPNIFDAFRLRREIELERRVDEADARAAAASERLSAAEQRLAEAEGGSATTRKSVQHR